MFDLKANTFLFVILIMLTACSDSKLAIPETEGEKLQILYNQAMSLVKKRDFVDAAILFEDIERQYPYSKWSNQAQLMSGFCYYKSNMHNESLDALERFIALYPGSEKISYAYYLRALNYYEQISDVERDQTTTTKAKRAFNEVINKYPDSDFASDALNRIDVINDRLAAKEMEIARYYQFNHQWISAINRYNNILEEYKTSVYTEETLHRLVEIYYSLGLHEEAKRYAATLQFNFPESDWYLKSYELLKDVT
ncbi:outer membrane protein assembly factor BamD [Pelagibacterales bacterium SAG-MED32]|nr:outer membrane protein assembly factor BamD [Pelagibacterales bacterium SAG-MED32]